MSDKAKEVKLVKGIECVRCEKIFDCKGKPREVKLCVNFVERKKDGRR